MQRCVWLHEHCGGSSCVFRLSSQGICRVAGWDRFSLPAKLDSYTPLILTHVVLEIEKLLLICEWFAKNPILVLVLGILPEILHGNAPEATKTEEHSSIEAPRNPSKGDGAVWDRGMVYLESAKPRVYPMNLQACFRTRNAEMQKRDPEFDRYH